MLLYLSVNRAIPYELHFGYDLGEKLKNALTFNLEKIVQSKP